MLYSFISLPLQHVAQLQTVNEVLQQERRGDEEDDDDDVMIRVKEKKASETKMKRMKREYKSEGLKKGCTSRIKRSREEEKEKAPRLNDTERRLKKGGEGRGAQL